MSTLYDPFSCASVPPCTGNKRPADHFPPQSLNGPAGRGFYNDVPHNEALPVILAMIAVGLAGNIGAGLYWITVFAGWL